MKAKIIIFAILISSSVVAQQNALFNQYIFNELIINPAYAGSKGAWNANAIYSTQWIGLDGAPSTQTLSAEGPVSSKIGLGAHLINDCIGAQQQQAFYGSYSYKLHVNDQLNLNFGLAIGASRMVLDGSKLQQNGEIDPAIPVSSEKKMIFDSKAGLFLYSKRFYAGLSISELTSDIIKNKGYLLANQVRHYYLTTGYVFKLGTKMDFKPSIMIREDFKAPTNLDLNAFFLFNKKIWLGAGMRTGANIFNNNEDLDNSLRLRDAFVFMTEYDFNSTLRIGYSYTMTMTVLKNYPGHEFLLGYYFPDKSKTKMKTPRYF